MKNLYDIAVVGESMAGKSTWISNLFEEDITKQLKSICELNQEGQTKIPVYYWLENSSKKNLGIKSIGWNLEQLTKTLKEKENQKYIQRLVDLLNLPTEFNLTTEDVQGEIEDVLERYLHSDEYKVCIEALQTVDFISTVCNDSKIGELGIISFVEIYGAANVDVWKIIKDFGLDGVKIRDTRGFLDETEDKMHEFLESAKQNNRKENESIRNSQFEEVNKNDEYLQKLLDDRGIYGVDACVFMSVAGSNALSKKNNKSIYGPLIKNMLEKNPTFLVVRADKLTEIYAGNPDISYEESISKGDDGKYIQLGKFFTGFSDLRTLLKEYGLYDKSEDYRTDIARKHYKELILANIPLEDFTEEEMQDMGDIYRKSALGVFKEVLNGVQEYYKNIEEADRCLEALHGDHSEILKKLYDKEFDANIFLHSGDWGYCNRKFYYVTKYLSNKVQGSYYGGMVGVYGGLTTWITGQGRVGAAAIDFLETAYKLRKDLFSQLVDELDPEIKSYIQQRCENNVDISKEVKLAKQNLMMKFEKDIESNFERLSCTNRMIPRTYLKTAYDNTRKDLEVSYNYIGKYLPELKELFHDKRWDEDRHQMSVVKWLLWNLILLKK